ncbi:MAG TPA: PaaI family thioesterase [Ktedonobacterales bacterium]|nr:PaaI family thioesterase [Ktedonobacterales bacterium]
MSDTQPGPRERIIRWEDPLTAPREARRRGMSGLEFLRAIQAGELPPPPIAVLMGMTLDDVETGRVSFTVEPEEYHYNPIGVVHGGLAATLLDSAIGCAVQTLAPAGVAYTTVELKVNYVRPLRSGMGIVRGEGTVLHFGRQIALAEARVTDQAGKLYAHATSTCLIMRPDSPSEPTPEESR